MRVFNSVYFASITEHETHGPNRSLSEKKSCFKTATFLTADFGSKDATLFVIGERMVFSTKLNTPHPIFCS